VRRSKEVHLHIPAAEEFRRGYEAFRLHEARDAMYKVATFLISHFWGKYLKMSNALGVLLLTWNQGYYRYGGLNFDKLEKCLKNNFNAIEAFRRQEIFSLNETHRATIIKFFQKLLEALKRKGTHKKSPVAVAKALHLLAPGFFPLWDDKIARAYKCHYSKKPADKYILFCDKMKTIAQAVKNYDNIPNDVTILKLIDEYNYAKYTKNWI